MQISVEYNLQPQGVWIFHIHNEYKSKGLNKEDEYQGHKYGFFERGIAEISTRLRTQVALGSLIKRGEHALPFLLGKSVVWVHAVDPAQIAGNLVPVIYIKES